MSISREASNDSLSGRQFGMGMYDGATGYGGGAAAGYGAGAPTGLAEIAEAAPSQMARLAGQIDEIMTRYMQCDQISVLQESEMSGVLWKHFTYVISSSEHGISAVRRFSDVSFLNDVLVKRYPFRLVPPLPAKRAVGLDISFLESRRAGLARYLNAIARHPVLRNDELVVDFLSNQTDMPNWRKSNSQLKPVEEFLRGSLADVGRANGGGNVEDFEEKFKSFKDQGPAMCDRYAGLVHTFEKICKCIEGE